MVYTLKKLFSGLLIGVALLSGSVSHANNTAIDKAVADRAVELAKRVQSESLIATLDQASFENNLGSLSSRDKVNYLRRITMSAIDNGNQLPLNTLIPLYSEAAYEAKIERDITLSELYALYNDYKDTGGQFSDFEGFKTNLTPFLENTDWFISHRARILLATAESLSLDLNTALVNALEAFNKIPNEKSADVDEAVIESLDNIAYLYNLLNNPELALEATETLINRRLEKGYDVDGISLISNLTYSFGKWQDFETTSKLAEILVALDTGQTSSVKGLSHLRLAQILNDKSDYQRALNTIDAIMPDVSHKSIKANLLINRTVALTGLGRIKEAEQAKTTYDNFKSEINLTSNNLYSRELMGDALLAQAKGDMDTAFAKMRERYTHTVQRILTSNNSSTAKLLANLENSATRQAERESGLEREANLQKSRAEQKARANQLLIILAAFLSMAAFLAIIFARYRDKASKALAIKTLEAEDADRLKSEFLGMVSHELRTPLNGIVGIADLLTMQAPTPDLRHKAGIILDSSNKLTHVIESIVDMSTIDGDKMVLYPEPTNVHDVVTELEKLWRPQIESKEVIFTSFVENSLSEDIVIDKARFRQCLNSLLSNAAKFTDSGRIHLHLTAKPSDSSDETEITAIIADTGQGMSKAVQEKLFTPFLQADSTMTRKHGGSGLGLSITQSLARMMGGDVTMVSNQGRGSEFTFTVRGERSDSAKLMDDVEELLDMIPSIEMAPVLPEPPVQEPEVQEPGLQDTDLQGADLLGSDLQNTAQEDTLISHDTFTSNHPNYAPIELTSDVPELDAMKTVDIEINAPVTRAEAPKRRDTDNLRGLKVLIVEDITANQDIIKLFLKPEGCEYLCAQNGFEALDVLNTQDIDVILMDIRMPDMDGIEATRAIRGSNRDYKNTPIIALTADVSAETNAACMAAGADIFLTKPIMARELIESIRFVRRFQDTDDAGIVNAA